MFLTVLLSVTTTLFVLAASYKIAEFNMKRKLK